MANAIPFIVLGVALVIAWGLFSAALRAIALVLVLGALAGFAFLIWQTGVV